MSRRPWRSNHTTLVGLFTAVRELRRYTIFYRHRTPVTSKHSYDWRALNGKKLKRSRPTSHLAVSYDIVFNKVSIDAEWTLRWPTAKRNVARRWRTRSSTPTSRTTWIRAWCRLRGTTGTRRPPDREWWNECGSLAGRRGWVTASSRLSARDGRTWCSLTCRARWSTAERWSAKRCARLAARTTPTSSRRRVPAVSLATDMTVVG